MYFGSLGFFEGGGGLGGGGGVRKFRVLGWNCWLRVSGFRGLGFWV